MALEDFARLCAEARAHGTSMQELQLQLILAQGALPLPFGKKALVPGEEGGAEEQASLAVEAEVRAQGGMVPLPEPTIWCLKPFPLPAACCEAEEKSVTCALNEGQREQSCSA